MGAISFANGVNPGRRQQFLDKPRIYGYMNGYNGRVSALTTYSVADAKNGLPRLIDRALAGEEVIISRHGKPVVELRPALPSGNRPGPASYEWLRSGRVTPKGPPITSVELLNQIYEDPEA
jgi:prevent-host-death family protein